MRRGAIALRRWAIIPALVAVAAVVGPACSGGATPAPATPTEATTATTALTGTPTATPTEEATVATAPGGTPAATPTESPSPGDSSAPEAADEEGALALLAEAAEVLRHAYVETGFATQEAIAMGALQGLLEAAQVSNEVTSAQLQKVKAAAPPGFPAALEDVWRAWRLVLDGGTPVNPADLAQGAVVGMLQATGDEDAQFLDPQSYRQAREFLTGEYEGIGAVVVQQGDLPFIVSVTEDGPAGLAGLGPGDRIFAVEGEPIEGLTLEEQVALVKGTEGTDVRLLVLRPNGGLREVRLTRSVVHTPSVATRMLPDDIGYLRLSHFSQQTGSEFIRELGELLNAGAAALVLDLRGNSGGSLEAVVTVVSQVIDQGTVYTLVDATGQEQEWSANQGGLALDLPLAVLVDDLTAQAGEAVAAALQDYGRARILGTSTAGKGTIQSFRELADGSALYVTTSRWYTPKGRTVEGQGLEPDVAVALTEADIQQRIDRPLQEAHQYLVDLLEGSSA